MTTETKAPTEADVAKDYEMVRVDLEASKGLGMFVNPKACAVYDARLDGLARLRDLALLGVQVSGLKEQVDRLHKAWGNAVARGASWHVASGLKDDAKPSDLEADLRKRDAEVSALQARVAELEQREKVANADRAVMREYADRFKTAASERDALRALLEEAAEAMRTGGSGVTRNIRIKILAALSTSPAEAKPCPSSTCDTRTPHRHHPEGDVFAPAEPKPGTSDHEDWCRCARCVSGNYHPDE